MSIRLEMLQVARLAPKLLGESADLVHSFLLAQQNDDGGFKDRTGNSDLYYTVFGLDGLLALATRNPAVTSPDQTLAAALSKAATYVNTFEFGEGLDFVHLCCLARCWGTLCHASAETGGHQPDALLTRRDVPAATRTGILRGIETFRTDDGGYSVLPQSQFGTAYACFLALAAYQDLGAQLPDSLRMVQCLKFLETNDGAWANERSVKIGSTNATAAAVTLLRHLNVPIHHSVGQWLLARCHGEGGFLAAAAAPIPDLLTTATSLHALAGLQVSFDSVRENCLDFIDTLWTNEGGFHGNWTDDHLDTEYTYYGLLALGHLSL